MVRAVVGGRAAGPWTPPPGPGQGLAELNGLLWDEQELLADLLFALGAEQWLLAGGHTRWLDRAAQRVRAANDRLRDAEVLRAAEADVAAAGLGLAAASSLTELAESAGEPWRTILLEQRTVLLAAAAEISGMAGRASRTGRAGGAGRAGGTGPVGRDGP